MKRCVCEQQIILSLCISTFQTIKLFSRKYIVVDLIEIKIELIIIKGVAILITLISRNALSISFYFCNFLKFPIKKSQLTVS